MKFSTKQEGVFAVLAILIMVFVWPSSPTLAIIVGIAALLFFAGHEFSKGGASGLNEANEARQEEKEDNRREIMEYLDDHENVTNDDVQRILNVSHATASNYLSELEQDGLLREHGEGSAIHYKKRTD